MIDEERQVRQLAYVANSNAGEGSLEDTERGSEDASTATDVARTPLVQFSWMKFEVTLIGYDRLKYFDFSVYLELLTYNQFSLSSTPFEKKQRGI